MAPCHCSETKNLNLLGEKYYFFFFFNIKLLADLNFLSNMGHFLFSLNCCSRILSQLAALCPFFQSGCHGESVASGGDGGGETVRRTTIFLAAEFSL